MHGKWVYSQCFWSCYCFLLGKFWLKLYKIHSDAVVLWSSKNLWMTFGIPVFWISLWYWLFCLGLHMIHLIIYKIYKIIVSKKMLAYDFFLSVYIVQRVGGRETLRAELLLVHIIISLYCIPVFYYHKFSLNHNTTFREVHCLIQLIKELLTMFHYTFIDMGWGQGVWRNRKEKWENLNLHHFP